MSTEEPEIDLRDRPEEIDLRDRLRFAAGSLAADFGDHVAADDVEALVFSSADILLANASVTEFVPILAERRARLAIRSGAMSPATPPAPAPAAPASPGVPPLVSVPESQMARLRETLAQARDRVAGWRAGQDRR